MKRRHTRFRRWQVPPHPARAPLVRASSLTSKQTIKETLIARNYGSPRAMLHADRAAECAAVKNFFAWGS